MTCLKPNADCDDMLKIVVMNDLHLVSPGSPSPNMDTSERFDLALQHAVQRHSDADLCVFAGDIADKGDAGAYAVFDRLRCQYEVPQCVTLGNHDDRTVYTSTAANFEMDPNGYIQCRRDIKGHCILVLDSSEPGRTRGGFSKQKRDWIHAQLSDAKDLDLPVIVILHHNPSALQMPVDAYRLDEPDVLKAALLESGANIMQIVSGHCHISSAGSWSGIPCATIAGNHHSVEPFLRRRTGQQECYASSAEYGVVVSNGADCAVHFETYIGAQQAMDHALFPKKKDQTFEPMI
ncbi:metallophosphoesterase [Epibacterium ulvae]|uniref:metallophosphoesterase n=1 Tax=Epibacterium ulvae TaxID=1156985 RepID=UPI00249318C5|nr:metallophosphoesterase [Epibacterium ulvae]